MLFTAVDQIKRRFPDKDICLLSTQDFKQNAIEKIPYRFQILPWNLKITVRLLGFWNKLFVEDSEYDYLAGNIEKVVKNADCVIDISGYGLSSVWGFHDYVSYMLNMVVAKKCSIPYYVFPQSIGPFNYSLKCNEVVPEFRTGC